jgi:ferredoxin
MEVRVDGSCCQGHTPCAVIAPESFELDDVDGHARATHAVVPPQLHGQVHEAAQSCPEQAVVVLAEHDGHNA